MRNSEKTHEPLVSISIICYQQKAFIRESILSALTQDYSNLEVVVADDGSSDGTTEIIFELAARFPGRLVPLTGSNLGITGNSNRALSACRGKYIAFMGGDDVLLPGKISAQVKWFEENADRVLCYHDIDVFDSNNGRTLYRWSDKYRFQTGHADKIIKFGTFFGATSVMIRNPGTGRVVFNPNVPFVSDWLYWIEAVEEQGGSIGFVDGVFARYRRHPGNITRKRLAMLEDRLKVLDIVSRLYPHYKRLADKKRPEILFNEAARSFLSKDPKTSAQLVGKMINQSKGHFGWPLRSFLRVICGLKY